MTGKRSTDSETHAGTQANEHGPSSRAPTTSVSLDTALKTSREPAMTSIGGKAAWHPEEKYVYDPEQKDYVTVPFDSTTKNDEIIAGYNQPARQTLSSFQLDPFPRRFFVEPEGTESQSAEDEARTVGFTQQSKRSLRSWLRRLRGS